MDSILPDLPGMAGFGGVLFLLAWLIVHLNRQASSDRKDYQEALHNLRERHGIDTQALTTRHDLEMDKLRAENQRLRDELEGVREQLAQARKARWQAEDDAARWRRRAGVDDGVADDG